MGTDQSKMGGYGEKGGGWAWRGGSKRTRPPVDPNTAVAASEGKPDVPPAHLARFTQALLAQMKTDIGDLNALASLIVGENYKASGKTIDEVKTEDGLTALHAAVLAEKPQVVKFLLECGCQPRTLSANWQTALHDAILKGNHDLVRLLLEFGAPNVCLSTNRIGELPLHTAAQLFTQPNGEKIFWDMLICSGLQELNRPAPNGLAALHVAAVENYAKLIRILLEPTRNGPPAFVNVASSDGNTPLHLSASKGHRKATQALLDFGADPNATNFFGEVPLHFACQASTDQCAEAILSVDPLWRKGDSKRPATDVPSSPRPPQNVKDSNHLRAVVTEVKDYGLNLPLHYASGWVGVYTRKMYESKPEEVAGPTTLLQTTQTYTAPGSSSSSSNSTSTATMSDQSKKKKVEESMDDSDKEQSAPIQQDSAVIAGAEASSSSPAAETSNGSVTHSTATNGNATPTENSKEGVESTSAKAKEAGSKSEAKKTKYSGAIRPRSLSIKLIERMLDLEMRHSRHPLYRKYAFSILAQNRAGWSPYDIAEANGDTELLDLFRTYMPPEADIPPESDFISIQLASDIHLECLSLDQPSGRKIMRNLVQKSKAKYVALLGDIGIATRPYYRDYLIRMSKRYTYVFVVYGNHEFYHSTTRAALAVIEQVIAEYPNIIWLRAGHPFEVEGVKIIGDTLWSNVLEDEMENVATGMSDYRQIEVVEGSNKRKLTVHDTLSWHKTQLRFIKEEIAKSKKNNQPVIVMTHHAPLMRFGVTNPGYWESPDADVGSAFASDLSGLLSTPVVAWLYGHTHWNHNMVINDTLIAANQSGYIFSAGSSIPTNYDPKFTVKVLKKLPPAKRWAHSNTPAANSSL